MGESINMAALLNLLGGDPTRLDAAHTTPKEPLSQRVRRLCRVVGRTSPVFLPLADVGFELPGATMPRERRASRARGRWAANQWLAGLGMPAVRGT